MKACYSKLLRRRGRVPAFIFASILAALAVDINARELTLAEAVDMALNQTSRGSIIRGKEEVAEQNYYARRINFLLPEISINGELPAYSNDESYRFFGADPTKSLFKTRELDFNSFIELKQSVPITGGSVTASANLSRVDSRYPDTRLFLRHPLPRPFAGDRGRRVPTGAVRAPAVRAMWAASRTGAGRSRGAQ